MTTSESVNASLSDPIVGQIDGEELAIPIHVQKVEKAVQLEPLLNFIDHLLTTDKPAFCLDEDEISAQTIVESDSSHFDSGNEAEGIKMVNGIAITRSERKADKTRLYNFGKVRKNRRWLKTLLLSDTSSDDDVELAPVTDDHLRAMLKMHKYQKQCKNDFGTNRENQQYMYYSSSLLSAVDNYAEHQKSIIGVKKFKAFKDQRKLDKKKSRLKRLRREYGDDYEEYLQMARARRAKKKPLTPEQAEIKRKRIWATICKRDIVKAQKQKASARKEVLSNLRKVAHQCMRSRRRGAIQSMKLTKDAVSRARRLSREMQTYWKRFEKVEKESRKRAEKEALEQRKIDMTIMEARRQQRKLNFLITQTELYAHFMARKLTGEGDEARDRILQALDESIVCDEKGDKEVVGGTVTDVLEDAYAAEETKSIVLRNAEKAYSLHQAKRETFDQKKENLGSIESVVSSAVDRHQPEMFIGSLKGYQLKGMNWLANLYDQGINGILADEMGLGKTIQSLAFLSYLAETCNIWGPFLVVAPASTLHNWQQECSRFLPKLKCVPYWGNTQDRKILRKFWNSSHAHTASSSFHVVITSYQLIIQDVRYFQRINWHYMILDEAQAIKSSSSVRWKILLSFNCRNRLLLTGTPIQNSMAELWALLHFIMPTLFDSHDEFNEWFSKDIESHAEHKSALDENQLSRLHMIIKPFMLRRVKRDVENELSDKIEIMTYCPLTTRQRLLYQAIKNKISIDDLLQSSTSRHSSPNQASTNSLMNLVMQFRKVCNHPELFERREIRSGFYMRLDPYPLPVLVHREGLLDTCLNSRRHLLYSKLCIYHPDNIHKSYIAKGNHVISGFSFLRFIDVSPMEMSRVYTTGLLYRWFSILMWWKTAYTIHHLHSWQPDTVSHNRYLLNKLLMLAPLRPTGACNVATSSDVLRRLIFTSPLMTSHGHSDHVIRHMPETYSHRRIRLRSKIQITAESKSSSPVKTASLVSSPRATTASAKAEKASPKSSVHSPAKQKPRAEMDTGAELELLLRDPNYVHKHISRPDKTLSCQLTDWPSFSYYSIPEVRCGERVVYCPDRSAAYARLRASVGGSLEARDTLMYGCPEQALVYGTRSAYVTHCPPMGIEAVNPKHGYSGILVPDKETLVSDAGKLHVLDSLLARLKSGHHRVLIYSQMTRMIDILEEYMWHRKHTYIRLDGSSKISDRRDLVADFQSRSDIFVFLLSTRAGGLGINLTAADTVIFYDSDWNPTVDQQAMDRAHRLGQTKQVTVYRLVCKGTIEERILQRAKEKSEIQRMVISGGSFKTDQLKPKEVVSLLLDDAAMQRKFVQKQKDATRRDRDVRRRGRPTGEHKVKDGKRKRADEPCQVSSGAPGDTESVVSLESTATSPVSESSDHPSVQCYNDSSNDALVIAEDTSNSGPCVKRGRGRPKGKRSRGRGSVRNALSAAELHGAQAGMQAAYAAYGYNFKGPLSANAPGRGTQPSGALPQVGTPQPKDK